MTTKEAIQHLTMELRNDRSYWYSWQANIAMAFYDTALDKKMIHPESVQTMLLHEVANAAAARFLELLTSPPNEAETYTQSHPVPVGDSPREPHLPSPLAHGAPDPGLSMDQTTRGFAGGDRGPLRTEVAERPFEEEPLAYLHNRLHTPEGKLAWISLIKFTTEHYRKSTPYEVLDWLMAEFERVKPIL